MSGKVIAIVGSYRKGGITDQTVDAVLEAVRQSGGETGKIYLTDKKIKFCLNCRACMQDLPEESRGQCGFSDDMSEILDEIDKADGIVLASPVNFGTVTAVMKRFVERCAVYGYWPWGKPAPRFRPQKRVKKAVLTTSSACPAVIARFLRPSSLNVMKECASVLGAKKIKTLYFGMVCGGEKQKLDSGQLKQAKAAGDFLVKA